MKDAAKPDLSGFPITRRWPAKDPAAIQLYSLATPNGVKVSAALEELGLAYEAQWSAPLPAEPTDQALDMIVTEAGVFRVNG